MLMRLQNDLTNFHEAHFSTEAIIHFADLFTAAGCTDQDPKVHDQGDYDEDDLGYYDDGVKRTLTDEQIEIFRHSEIEQLRRASEKKDTDGRLSDTNEEPQRIEKRGHADQQGQKRKRKGKKQPVNPKPDLRKRTWDKVEKGLDTLEYD